VATIEDKILIYKRNVPMITFTAKAPYTEEKSYTAEEGMTWGEWLESEYYEPDPQGTDWLVDSGSGQVCAYTIGDRYALHETNNSGAYVYTSSVIKSIQYYYRGEK
jgi:hypothetical protein